MVAAPAAQQRLQVFEDLRRHGRRASELLAAVDVAPAEGEQGHREDHEGEAPHLALDVVEVLFDDQPQAFSNINTEAELRSASSDTRV